jgi:hypothetical protein
MFLALTENPCLNGVEPGAAKVPDGTAFAQYPPADTDLFRVSRDHVC